MVFPASRTADSRESEAQLLASLVRLSPATLLLADDGAGKSLFLADTVLPLLAASSVADTEVCILFSRWQEAPLPALIAQIRRAIPVLDGQRANETAPSISLAATLARWQYTLDARFIIVLDRFEEHLAAVDRPDTAAFDDELVRVMSTPELRVHFLIALDESAAPLLERLRGRVPGLGDTSIRLPRSVTQGVMTAPPTVAGTPFRTASLVGSPAVASASPEPPLPNEAASGSATSAGLIGSRPPALAREASESPVEAARAAAKPAQAFGAAVIPAAVSEEAPAEAEQSTQPAISEVTSVRAASSGEDVPSAPEAGAGSDTEPLHVAASVREVGDPMRALRMPRAAWAVLGLLAVSAACLLLLTLWQPKVSAPEATVPPAVDDPTSVATADANAGAEEAPPPSPADDQTPLPLVASEVPRREVTAPSTVAAPAAVPAESLSSKAAAKEAPPAPRPMAALYIHVRSESQRAWAEQLVQPLARRGVRISGIKVVPVGPEAADLRYFRGSEAREAARVARALREVGVPAPRLKRVAGFESSSTARQYELWLPPGRPSGRGIRARAPAGR